jgi:hypothetical protein
MSPLKLTDAGKHFLLGEMIGKTVIEAVKEALFLQTGFCPERQMDIFRRMDRFGITEDALVERALKEGIAYGSYSERLPEIAQNKEFVIFTSLYAHLIDQYTWGMLPGEETIYAADRLLAMMGMPPLLRLPDTYEALINAYFEGLIEKIR